METPRGWIDFFTPLPVMMISTMSRDKQWRCSPFTWCVPVSKDGFFAIMMRETSVTLENMRSGCRVVTCSQLPVSMGVAQAVLVGRKDRLNVPFKESSWWVDAPPVPNIALRAMLARAKHFYKPGGETGTHVMVVLKVLQMIEKSPEPPLMFSSLRTFWGAEKFEVEGY